MDRSPRIFYFCYDHDRPLGGQKSTYQHVDALNCSGFNAAVVHGKPGYRLQWFENDTRVICWEKFVQEFDVQRDYLVLPEDLGYKIAGYPGRKVIFNKGLYNGFLSAGLRPSSDPCLRSDVVAILTVSEHSRQHLQCAYPRLPVIRVWTAIDDAVFRFRPLSMKKRQIAYVGKAKGQLFAVCNTVNARTQSGLNRGEEFRWIALQNRSEAEVAEVLGDSMLLLFCSVEEGCPRTPLEAMLCGCLPIAYGAGPMKEYLPETLQCEYGNAIAMVQIIEKVMAWKTPLPFPFQKEIEEGQRTARAYSKERQQHAVCVAWNTICGIPGSGNDRAELRANKPVMATEAG